MNMQNMPRPKKDANGNDKSKLRYSLEAPPGHKVVACDLGQIEARLVAWLCRELTLLEEFSKYDAGDKSYDPYNRLGSAIFGRPVNRKLVGTPDEIMGFIGKTGILGLGYGCGKDKFDTMVVRGARAQGQDISAIYNRQIGDLAVDTYRSRYSNIPAGWNTLNQIVANQWSNATYGAAVFGPVRISYGRIELPNGLSLMYDQPHFTDTMVDGPRGPQNKREFFYRYGKFVHRLYGAKLLENISQALARIVVMNAALRIRGRGLEMPTPSAYRFVLQAHDELVYIIPDAELDQAKKIIHEEMTRRPSWGRDLPLVADINHGNSYGEAK